jgi:hypothetical protein
MRQINPVRVCEELGSLFEERIVAVEPHSGGLLPLQRGVDLAGTIVSGAGTIIPSVPHEHRSGTNFVT